MTSRQPNRQRNQSEQSQTDRFIETARALGCDESEAAFEAALAAIAKAKPAPKGPKPKKKRSYPSKRIAG